MGKKIGLAFATILWLIIVIGPGVYGWEYYTAPLKEKPFMDAHELLKPTGLIGHGYGIIGSLFMMIGVASYSSRKRFTFLHNVGKLSNWLKFHIFLCTSGPALVFWHTSMKFNGIVSISFWSMVAVVASGVIGRYVYRRIPKTEEGHFKNVDSILVEQKRIWADIAAIAPLSDSQKKTLGLQKQLGVQASLTSALTLSLRHDVSTFFSRSQDAGVIASLGLEQPRQMELQELVKEYRWHTLQQHLLEPLQRIFGYWHVFHLPLTTIMFIILAVHIAVAITFGYDWIF